MEISSELHLFILWENALYKKQDILEHINEKFKIIKIYNIKWSDRNFIKNLSRFYGTNLPDCEAKAAHCGRGQFCLIIVKDENPIYEDRNTSKGIKRLNINMFDAKEKFRQLTGGGHKVHATNDEIETNHDITLLLNLSAKDFLNKNNKEWDGNEEDLEKDLAGADGWKDAQEMFYVLNNCIKYAILRNYEGLPKEIYINEHNDIDIICESKENCAYILNAEKVFPEEYRIHYKAKVADKYANFDLRYIGDNYYEEKLEKEILERRVYNKAGFYVLSEEDYYYTLLYHAIIHKKIFKPDYKARLISKNNSIINKNTTIEEMIEILKKWLQKHNYLVTSPEDKSVDFNFENANKFRPLVEIKKRNLSLTEFDANIVKWYPFKNETKILLVGENPEIEKYLVKTASTLATISRFDDISKFNEEVFDYVVIYGIEKYDNIINKASKYLNQNGKMLIIGNNTFGINTWSKYSFENYSGVNRLEKHDITNITIKEIEKQLKCNGFNELNKFYVFPDYINTELIVNDKFKIQKSQIEKYFPSIESNEIKIFDENKVLKNILISQPEIIEFFANSFIIEVSKDEIKNDIKYISFNNCRKEKYRLITLIRENVVQKIAANEKAEQHISEMKQTIKNVKECGIDILDYEENENIYSTLIKEEKTLDEIISENSHDLKYIANILNQIKEILIKHSEKYSECQDKIRYDDENILKKLHFMKNAFWDMVPKNCFYINNKYVFFDQEWETAYLPVEFIIYRSIINSYDLVRKINVDELLKLLEIYEYKEYFEKIDKEIRDEIIDENIYQQIYCKKIKTIHNILNDNSISNFKLKQVMQDNQKKQEYINILEKDTQSKQEYINSLENDNKKKQEYIIQLETENKKKQEYIKVLEERKTPFWKR